MGQFYFKPQMSDDGGFWYVVESVPDSELGGQTPGDIPSGWCAWYKTIGGVDCVVVRMPEPAVIPRGPEVESAQIVDNYGGKPFGRVGDR